MNQREVDCCKLRLRLLSPSVWAALVLAACSPPVQDAPVTAGAYATPVRLACVGDSLTEVEDGWPAHLDRMLDECWEVRNFGCAGATILTLGDHPYATLKLPEVVAYQPDVVVILLGTNDSKPRHWYYHKAVERDFGQMLSDLKGMASRPRIWICLPPPAFPGQWGIDEGRLREVRLVLRRVARRNGIPVIDLQAPFVGRSDWFPDQVHPDARASAEMARRIRQALTGTPGAPEALTPRPPAK